MSRRYWSFVAVLAAAVALLVTTTMAQDQGQVGNSPSRKPLRLLARLHRRQPERSRQDRVHAADIPHSFTIDEYRIAKRAGTGQTVTFEFRSRPGRPLHVLPATCRRTTSARK